MPKQHPIPWAEPGFLDLWAQAPALRHVHPVPRPMRRMTGDRRRRSDRGRFGKRRSE